MNGRFDPCAPYRQPLCLLVSGTLPEPERDQLQRHLHECANCRQYLAELKSVTAPLAGWEAKFAQLQPSLVARARWAEALQSARRGAGEDSATGGRQPSQAEAIQGWWREVIWSSRRTWAGLAAVWLLILAGHLALQDQPQPRAGRNAAASKEIVTAFKERQVILAEILGDPTRINTGEADRPKMTVPRPRTENVKLGMG